jgi:hypothetical protein
MYTSMWKPPVWLHHFTNMGGLICTLVLVCEKHLYDCIISLICISEMMQSYRCFSHASIHIKPHILVKWCSYTGVFHILVYIRFDMYMWKTPVWLHHFTIMEGLICTLVLVCEKHLYDCIISLIWEVWYVHY